jgi:hypothetical protein
MIKVSYYFNPVRAGAMGYIETTTAANSMCGNIVHVNTRQEIVWMNNGMFKFNAKSMGKLKYETFTHVLWFDSLQQMGNSKWDLDKRNYRSCLRGDVGDVKPHLLGEDILVLLGAQMEIQRNIVDILKRNESMEEIFKSPEV